jgi:hypothetical protein
MSCQLFFTENDIYNLPFTVGDIVSYKDEKTTITSIYIRAFNESINDIIVTFSNGSYTFHDDHELKLIYD